jgi:sodium/potassium-transporting ATPase subunit alpha
LLAVAIINALIEFIQELKSRAILKSFLDLVPRKCMAIRDGQLVNVDASILVPGDVVNVRMGDKLPADIRVFSATEFKVDNSSLTGEADPQERTGKNTHENPLEATNLAFNGTLAVNGEAYGIVIRTGDNTVLGQIANMASSEKKRMSPLTHEIEMFVRKIAVIAFVFAIVFFAFSYANTGNLAFSINFAIGVFVSFVPEGLPATVTVCCHFSRHPFLKLRCDSLI